MSATTNVSAPSNPPRSSGFKGGGFRGKPREKAEPKTLFQSYFKSVGPRTYAAQIKEAGNGNHFLILTEGKRDDKTDEVKKIRLYLFSEDFEQFKNLLRDTFKFIAEHPVSPEVQKKREKFWQKQKSGGANKRS